MVTERVFAYVCRYIVFPRPRTGNRTVTQVLHASSLLSRTKNQPKEEVFGMDIPRTSGGHLRGYPGPKLRSGRSKSWKTSISGADIHDPKARTSTTLRGFQKLRSEMSGRRMSGTSRRFSRHSLNCNEKRARTWSPRLGLEVPEVLLPDIRDHLMVLPDSWPPTQSIS